MGGSGGLATHRPPDNAENSPEQDSADEPFVAVHEDSNHKECVYGLRTNTAWARFMERSLGL